MAADGIKTAVELADQYRAGKGPQVIAAITAAPGPARLALKVALAILDRYGTGTLRRFIAEFTSESP